MVEGESISTTEDHPFWSVTDQRFERADELSAGELVLDADGNTITVTGLDTTTARETTAYNLAINDIHTYHVGDADILVHNTCSPDLDAMSASGKAPDKNGLTVAGRSYQKHMDRGQFPDLPRSEWDSAGQDMLDDILTSPGTTPTPVTSGRFKGGTRYTAPDGRQATFDPNGNLGYLARND